MDWLQALILGLVQGLTEYLPVSSSGHLAIGSELLGIQTEESMMFTVAVHVATVLSTLVILGHEVWKILSGALHAPVGGQLNDDHKYVLNIVISMIPIGIVGVFFKDEVEAIFGSGLTVVGACLLLTALLLSYSYFAKPKLKEKISLRDAFIIGLSQALAVLPGLSRSGSTIATGLILGNKRSVVAEFSFLMVILPILGESLLDVIGGDLANICVGLLPLAVGFVTSFVSGCLACKFMLNIVNRGKLIWFAIYCLVVGFISIGSYIF